MNLKLHTEQGRSTLLSQIELELQKQVSRLDAPRTKPFYEMLTYHMGWTGEGAGPEATGKRIRPLMVILTCLASSGDESGDETWQSALPAAAAVELVHNFSLVHDDIQDNSDKRRGRPTTHPPCDLGQVQSRSVTDGSAAAEHQRMQPADVRSEDETPLQIPDVGGCA